MEEALSIKRSTTAGRPSLDRAWTTHSWWNSARQSSSREGALGKNDCSRDETVSRKCQGFNAGVRDCASAAIVTCILNLVSTIVAVGKYGVVSGLGTLQIGDCNTTKRLSQWLHLLINIVSTILLGASNYSMQGLSSPIRQMIDKAHQSGIWLGIGVPSIRNIRWLSQPRIAIWCLLTLSSVPLHLMYNSAVFFKLTYQDYNAFVVAETFPTGAAFSLPIDVTDSGDNFIFLCVVDGTRTSVVLPNAYGR